MSDLPTRSWKRDELIEYAKAHKIEIGDETNNFKILALINETLPKKDKKKKKAHYEISYLDLSTSRLFLEFEIKGEDRDSLRASADKKILKIAKRFKCEITDLWIQNVFANDQLMKVSIEMPTQFITAQLRKVIESC